MPRIDVSSSMLRARVAAGRSIRHLVPGRRPARIEELGLYRSPASGRGGVVGVMEPDELVAAIAEYAADKKAIDVVELDVAEILGYADRSSSAPATPTARRRRSTTASSRG